MGFLRNIKGSLGGVESNEINREKLMTKTLIENVHRKFYISYVTQLEYYNTKEESRHDCVWKRV